jgi:hypothetical protein
MKNQAFRRQNQRGSVIIYVFIFVMLFGALIFTMTKGFRSGSAEISDQQADLAASEILNTATTFRDSIKGLIIGGCAPTQISFENAVDTNYTNPSATVSCKVFNPSGGNLRWPQGNYNNGGTVTSYYFTATPEISGTSGKPLILAMKNIDDAICIAINNKLGIFPTGNAIPVDGSTMTHSKFIGSYSGTGNPPNNQDPSITTAKIACVKVTSSNYNFFYAVLHAEP